jgi:hypothetical protein
MWLWQRVAFVKTHLLHRPQLAALAFENVQRDSFLPFSLLAIDVTRMDGEESIKRGSGGTGREHVDTGYVWPICESIETHSLYMDAILTKETIMQCYPGTALCL